MLDANTYDLESGEWQQVCNQYNALETRALEQFATLPSDVRDAYRQIILFPIQAMSNLHRMYYAQAMNRKSHKEKSHMQDYWADECEKAFRRDSVLCAQYNLEMSGGKWNGMMIQKHIGYKTWNDDFPKDICPQLYRTTANDSFDVINIQAPDYTAKQDAAEAQWTLIPDMGKGKGAMTLMPYKKPVTGASVSYTFKGKAGKAIVHIVTKSTLDYLNKGGLTYGVSVDGASPTVVNFNDNLNEKPENIYDIYYPTIARRVVDKTIVVDVQPTADGNHTITLTPNDPAIVFEKIIIDYRPNGGRVSHL